MAQTPRDAQEKRHRAKLRRALQTILHQAPRRLRSKFNDTQQTHNEMCFAGLLRHSHPLSTTTPIISSWAPAAALISEFAALPRDVWRGPEGLHGVGSRGRWGGVVSSSVLTTYSCESLNKCVTECWSRVGSSLSQSKWFFSTEWSVCEETIFYVENGFEFRVWMDWELYVSECYNLNILYEMLEFYLVNNENLKNVWNRLNLIYFVVLISFGNLIKHTQLIGTNQNSFIYSK